MFKDILGTIARLADRLSESGLFWLLVAAIAAWALVKVFPTAAEAWRRDRESKRRYALEMHRLEDKIEARRTRQAKQLDRSERKTER